MSVREGQGRRSFRHLDRYLKRRMFGMSKRMSLDSGSTARDGGFSEVVHVDVDVVFMEE